MTCRVYHLDHTATPLPLEIVRLADVMITDPPYSSEVHDNAVSCSNVKRATKRELGFESLPPGAHCQIAQWAGQVRRWSVIFSDVENAHRYALWSNDPELTHTGGPRRWPQYIRTIPWVRWSMPQLTGDRPTQGFESLVVLHSRREVMAKRWNGRGGLMAFEDDDGTVPRLDHKCLRGDGKHKAEKPLDLCLDLVSWFSDPGETVFDPYSGSAAIGYACALLGRSYVGLERDPSWVEKSNARLALPPIERDLERIRRWLAREDTEKNDGPALARRVRREADKERVRSWLIG